MERSPFMNEQSKRSLRHFDLGERGRPDLSIVSDWCRAERRRPCGLLIRLAAGAFAVSG